MQYKYRVRAVSDTGPGPWSPETIVTTTSECRTQSRPMETVGIS